MVAKGQMRVDVPKMSGWLTGSGEERGRGNGEMVLQLRYLGNLKKKFLFNFGKISKP